MLVKKKKIEMVQPCKRVLTDLQVKKLFYAWNTIMWRKSSCRIKLREQDVPTMTEVSYRGSTLNKVRAKYSKGGWYLKAGAHYGSKRGYPNLLFELFEELGCK